MNFTGLALVSQDGQTEFARKIAELLPPTMGMEEFGNAYAGSIIFLLAALTQQYPKACEQKDFLIKQAVMHLESELMENQECQSKN